MSQNTEKEIPHTKYPIAETEHVPEESSLGELKETVRQKVDTAKAKANESLKNARSHTAASYDKAKGAANLGYEASKDAIVESNRRHPLAYTLGAFAAGILLGAVVSASRSKS